MPTIGEGIVDASEHFAAGMRQYHKEHLKRIEAAQLGDAITRMELPDPNKEGKTIPLFSKEAQAAWNAKSEKQKAYSAGAQEALARMTFQAMQAAGKFKQTMNVQAGGQTFPVSPSEALDYTVQQPERSARTEHLQEQTTASQEERKAAAEEPSVAMDIGGGNFARVKVNELIKHPEFLRDQSAKDLNNQIFASTGLSIPQVAQGWNKRIVNGQLSFEAPVVQQSIDPITQKPIPKYNANGTPAYETVQAEKTKDNPSGLVTKTMRYNVPQEFTPDVLRLTGTTDVSGAENIKIPAPKDTGSTRIVPGSVQSGPQIPTVGEVRKGFRFKGGDPSDPNNWEPGQ